MNTRTDHLNYMCRQSAQRADKHCHNKSQHAKVDHMQQERKAAERDDIENFISVADAKLPLPASEQASERASGQAWRQAGVRVSERASKKASKKVSK